jgi:hypothetical protein
LFALMPKTISTIPTASKARLIANFLFIFLVALDSSVCSGGL